MTAATVLIPTHDAAQTLDLAVQSALRQTVSDLDVVIIGDGVTPEVRALTLELMAADERVRFLDRPKGEHHGEIYRDEAIRAARSPVICYLCDDDLLLPHHVASMIDLLADADLAHSLNGHLEPDGRFWPYWSDLSSPEFRRWLFHPERNSVSVTGTAHTVAAYLRVPVGWEVPPPGRWTDHYMWQKILALPDVRAVTSDRVTALQFPTHMDGRRDWAPAQRREELLRWMDQLADPEGLAAFDDLVRGTLNRKGAELQVVLFDHFDALAAERQHSAELRARIDELESRVSELDATAAASRQEREDLVGRLALIEGSRAWRLRNAIVRGPLNRLVRH